MVKKSRGTRRQTRDKFRGPEKLTVNKLLTRFKTGERVAIKISSNSQRGQPYKRFQGQTGIVTGTRGAAFLVQIHDQNKAKLIIAAPEHLKRV